MYIYVWILCIWIHLNMYIYIYVYTYIYYIPMYIYIYKNIFFCEYMYKYLQRYPNLSDFQSVASFVPSRSLAPAMTACFYAGRSSYNPSTIPTVRILNESGPWVSPQMLPKTERGSCAWNFRKEPSKLDDTCHGRFILDYIFLIGFRFQFKSISFRSYQKWWFPTTKRTLPEPVRFESASTKVGRICFHLRIVECIHMIC